MRTVFPLLFYPWLFVSLIVLVRRRLRRRSERRLGRSDPATTAARTVDDTQAAVLARLAQASGTTNAPEGDAVHGSTVAAATDGAGAAVADPATAPGDAPTDRPTVQAPAAAPALASASIPPPSTFRTLAELVRGIAMPCDLTPHFGDGPLVTDRAAFLTSTHAAHDVEVALQEELGRLGMKTIDPTSYGFMARGDRGTVEVRVYPNASLATAGGSTTFANARADAVAVELISR